MATVRRFLGWDCAVKSLAYALVDVDVDALDKLRKASNVAVLNEITSGFLTVRGIDVVDLIPGKKVDSVTDMEKISALIEFMKKLVEKHEIAENVIVVVEKQPLGSIGGGENHARNTRSAMVSFVIATFFRSRGNEVHFVSPKLKNKLVVGGNYCPEKSTYDERKKHTKAMLYYLADLWMFRHLVDKIRKDCHDDAADALMEIFAHIKKVNSGPKKMRNW